jgi:hypothetical protein
MKDPKLSRLAAKLFNQYKVPVDEGFSWAEEIDRADSEEGLSPELKEFLRKPYYINPPPSKINSVD